jgi:hypothetical protein
MKRGKQGRQRRLTSQGRPKVLQGLWNKLQEPAQYQEGQFSTSLIQKELYNVFYGRSAKKPKKVQMMFSVYGKSNKACYRRATRQFNKLRETMVNATKQDNQ